MATEKPPGSTTKEQTTGSFLLNIYPTPVHEGDMKLVGTLEKLGSDVKSTFHTSEELLHILGLNNVKSGGLNNERNE